MTVRGLAFAACLTLALTGASARADDAERTKVYGLVPPRAPHAPCHGGGRMGDQMALPSLGLGAFGGLPTGFFAVRASSGPGALVAGPRDAFFLDALFSQPERVTRAVYFSRALGDFGGESRGDGFKEAPAIGAVLVNDASSLERTESRRDASDDFEAFDDLAEAVARADSVMDALVRWRDDSKSDEQSSERQFSSPFAAWFETSAPFEEEAFFEEEAPRRRQTPPRPYGREGYSLDETSDAPDASPATRAAVGVAAFLLVVAAAVACARLVLFACDLFCRAVFGEEEEEEAVANGKAFVDVEEVSLAAPLLVAYETEERAMDDHRDHSRDETSETSDGEQLLVVVPAEPGEGRR
eukprot:CAMPEP_0203004022 /NCGR_PEP_ID=MMETSP1401-20130829/2167_1 /ASSEMBLY_ACC=CAM_ASM_000894 /TAXON_ID=38833 /ORGANISM="Micromonas pusilla, Strain CCAC1681" /LENGTH=354 /DNA_ID=CAMNT_0049745613 /DNA_START=52 /DNA_END=1116 /DNA_ORIENTATION=+